MRVVAAVARTALVIGQLAGFVGSNFHHHHSS
uniref:Uncharacterized protein n=1 Tax=Nymphaea colorata TaxID=210225 RepID=A0A5K1GJ06_9MAGN